MFFSMPVLILGALQRLSNCNLLVKVCGVLYCLVLARYRRRHRFTAVRFRSRVEAVTKIGVRWIQGRASRMV